MPRDHRRQTPDVRELEAEMQRLQERQRDLRQQIRRLRHGGTEIRKLEERLTAQLAAAKWTVRQLKELRPDWDEWGFYRSVEPQEPAQRTWRRQRREQHTAPPEAPAAEASASNGDEPADGEPLTWHQKMQLAKQRRKQEREATGTEAPA